MKRIIEISFLLIITAILSSCGSYKEVPYLENSRSVSYEESNYLYDAKIQPKDDVYIVVNCPATPEAAYPFNIVNTSPRIGNLTISEFLMKTYSVDNEGNIEYPLVGKIHVAGLTIDETRDLIKDKIKVYFNEKAEYNVYVELPDYRISVVGEVKNPGIFHIGNNKVSVFEALARAGDMTIYGVRTDVKLIREGVDGKKEVHSLDFTDANIINSPYYYMQSRDITDGGTK